MNNFRISTRLGVSFCFLLLLIVALAVVSVWRMRESDTVMKDTIQVRLKTERLITEWEKLTAMNALRTTAGSKISDPSVAAQIKEQMTATSARISVLQKAVDAAVADPGARALFDKVGKKRAAYRGARAAALKAQAAGDTRTAAQFFEKDMPAYLDAYVGSVGDLLAYEKHQIDLHVLELSDGNRLGVQLVAGVAALAVLIGLLLAWLISRSIVVPLRRAVDVAQTVSSHDLTAVIEVRGKDETSQLLDALRRMNEKLIQVVQEVRGGADAVAGASTQIAAGNVDLSSRTEEQASSLAETAATMEELTTTVRQNADNAQQASQLAEAAAGVAVKGGDVVSSVVRSMGAINESAKKVADIIGVIDSIAFQTNILALNAAVEAARAGEQGRGFAVVATEVRALAQRSAAAAKEIKALIDLSVSSTAEGNKLATEAGAAMTETVASIQRVTGIVGEISAASREQTTGIEQVNVALSQMDQVTQQNAALVEEASAASRGLREQATNLAGLVATFKVAAAEQPRPQPLLAAREASLALAAPSNAAVAALPA